MDQLTKFISDVGFPIFVAVVLMYVLYHMHQENHRTLDELARRIGELQAEVYRLVETLERRDRSRSSRIAAARAGSAA